MITQVHSTTACSAIVSSTRLRRALEERRAQFSFQGLDLLGAGWRCDVQPVRRTRHRGGPHRPRPPTAQPVRPALPGRRPADGECFIPAGLHEALGVALFDRGQRHFGHLTLLFCSKQPPPLVMRRRLHQLTPVLARGTDPLRSLAVAARVVKGTTAGAVLCCDGASRPLPGLDGDALLADGAARVAVALSCFGDGEIFTRFRWPRGGRHAPDGHVRVTVLASGEEPSTPAGEGHPLPATDLRADAASWRCSGC
jgi:hypothetical protein